MVTMASLKATTVLAMLHWLGIKPSYSRARVSDDNAFAEALFRTAKYHPEFPLKGFADLVAGRQWAMQFVQWYNHEHPHSGIRYVTPTVSQTSGAARPWRDNSDSMIIARASASNSVQSIATVMLSRFADHVRHPMDQQGIDVDALVGQQPVHPCLRRGRLCLTACLVSRPRASARPWPIRPTASDADWIAPMSPWKCGLRLPHVRLPHSDLTHS
jgi:hypothetical protein